MAKTPISTKLTTKQVDRLMKLIELANNNSAEHEANSAARSVCKILQGYIFKADDIVQTWNDVKRTETPDFKSTPPKATRQSRNPFEDFINQQFRGGFYDTRNQYGPGRPPPGRENTKTKQGPKEEKATPHSGEKVHDPYRDFREAYEKASKPSEIFEEYYKNFTVMTDEEFETFKRSVFEGKNKRILICYRCKKEVETAYVGPPGSYMCYQCQYEEHNRRR